MSNKILNKVNNDIFSYETTGTGGVFKMSRVMPTEIHHTTAGVGTNGYLLASTGNGWTWTDPATITAGTSLTAGTGVSITNNVVSIGQSVNTTDTVTFHTVSASNYNVGNKNVISASAQGSFTDLELKNNNGTKLLIDGDSGDIQAYGMLYIDNITRRDSNNTNGVAIESIYINGSTISASNYNVGNKNVISASAQGSFTDLELKNNNGTKLLIDGDSGDITCHGTLSIDAISEKTIGSGITLSSVVKMTGIQSATNSNKLLYDATTGEITYQPDSSGGATVIDGTSLRSTLPGNNVNASLSVSLGHNAGNSGQGANAVAIGADAGYSNQEGENVAIGYEAGRTSQGSGSIAIGRRAGRDSQADFNGIAIGNEAGMTRQGNYGIAIGRATGEVDQDYAAIAIGLSAGRYNAQGNSAVAIGHNAGNNNQGNWTVALGTHSATNDQSDHAVAVGDSAGRYSQSTLAVAVGGYAGNSNQGFKAVALGVHAGTNTQGQYTVAVGNRAGRDSQGEGSIAIGSEAGLDYQGNDCIAIGRHAGRLNDQGNQAVAIGFEAGYDNQGSYSIAIGNNAGRNVQAANSVVLNAQSGIALDAASTGFFVKPIRDVVNANKLLYNNTTGEITYQPDSSLNSVNVTTPNTGEILSYNGTNWVNNSNIKSLTGTLDGTSYDYINVTSPQHVKASWNYVTSLSITAPHASMRLDGGLFISSKAPITDSGGNKQVLGAIGAQFGGTPTDLEVDFMVEGTSMLIGDTFIGPNGNLVLFGDILSNSGQTILGSGGIVFETELGVWNEDTPKTYSSGLDGEVLVSQGSNRPPKWIQLESGGGTEIVGTGLRSILPGNNVNNINSISFGVNAGNTGQGENTIAIGGSAGQNNQSNWAVAIGADAGSLNSQGDSAVAVGREAGKDNQGVACTAIGSFSGWYNQGNFSTALGYKAGYNNLSQYSVAIGEGASFSNNSNLTNYIVINAQTEALNPSSSNGFHVKPIRNASSSNKLLYDDTTGEITYQPDSGAEGGGGGVSISKGMVVQYIHNDYKKQTADTGGTGWRAPDADLNTGFVVHIKPISALSKILVKCNVHVGIAQSQDARWWGARLYKKVGTGNWTHVSDADNSQTGNTANGTPVWFSDNMGIKWPQQEENELITNCHGSYLDTADSTEDIYYTIYWKSRLGENPGDDDLFINRQANNGDVFRPLPISSWSAIEIWDEGDTFTGTSSSGGGGGGISAPAYTPSLTTGPTLPDGNILDLDFRIATLSGTNVEIDGTVIGNTVGNGVTLSAEDGISNTTGSYISLDNTFSWTTKFTIELYLKVTGGNYNTVIAAWNNTNHDEHIWVARRGSGGLNFRTHSAQDHTQNYGNVLFGGDGNLPGFNGTFAHLILTHDSDAPEQEQKKAYINGVYQDQMSKANGTNPISPGPRDNFWIGRITTNWRNTDNGLEALRLFRIFDHVLTTDEITTLYENRDGTFNQTETVTDLTNYVLASNNADGTETKWLNVVPAPLSTSSEPALLDGNIESIDFTKATISGTNVEIDGTVIGTTVGTGVAVSDTMGISTTEASYVDLNMSTGFSWTPQFTLEFYFKMPSGSVDPQQYNGLFASFNGTAGGAFNDYLVVERRNTGDGIHFYTTLTDRNYYNTLYTESTVAGFDGTWGHLVLTNDSSQPTGSQKQMYVNGVLFTTGVQNVGSQVNFAATPRENYWVGRNGFGTQYENGVENLKIFRVYNRILTAEEAATLYENRDATETVTDVTNYALVSNNAVGTETKWLSVVPAPLSTSSGSTLPDGNLLDLDFRIATLSGTNVEIYGTVIGTTVGTGVTLTAEDGISSDSNSYIVLNTQMSWTINFSIELYFKLTGGNYNTIIGAWNNSSPDSHVWVARRSGGGPNFRTGSASDGWNSGNVLYSENSFAGWDGTYGHVVLTHDSSLATADQKRMYIDGVDMTHLVGVGGSGNPFNPGIKDNFWIGRQNTGWGNNDNGVENLRILRVFDHVLTTDEITTLYENRDGGGGASGSSDVTNYHLVSSNATGTETKWEPMGAGGGSSRPYAYFVNAAGGGSFGIFPNQYNDIDFDSSELSSGITLDSGGYNFTVDTSGVYKCTVSYRTQTNDHMTFVAIRDTSNNNIAYSQSLGSINSGTAAFFLMAQLDTGVSYKVSIYRYHNGTWVIDGTGLGHQIVCLLNMM